MVPKTRKGNEFKVVARILRVAAKGSSTQEIIDSCQLDPGVLENYLCGLAELRLLRMEGEASYKTTKKGLELLHIYHRLRWLLWRKENDFLLMKLLDRLTTAERDGHLFYVS